MTRAAIAKVQIARKELGLEDDDYRATLQRLTGQTSAKDCSEAQLGIVLDEFKRRGWQPRVVAGSKVAAPAAAKPAQSPAAKKARALWLSLWHLGAVRERSESALEAFAKRQLRTDKLAWADQQQIFRLIEALKAMATRHGWDQDMTGIGISVQVVVLKRRLVHAQCARIGCSVPYSARSATEHELDTMIREFGELVREKLPIAED